MPSTLRNVLIGLFTTQSRRIPAHPEGYEPTSVEQKAREDFQKKLGDFKVKFDGLDEEFNTWNEALGIQLHPIISSTGEEKINEKEAINLAIDTFNECSTQLDKFHPDATLTKFGITTGEWQELRIAVGLSKDIEDVKKIVEDTQKNIMCMRIAWKEGFEKLKERLKTENEEYQQYLDDIEPQLKERKKRDNKWQREIASDQVALQQAQRDKADNVAELQAALDKKQKGLEESLAEVKSVEKSIDQRGDEILHNYGIIRSQTHAFQRDEKAIKIQTKHLQALRSTEDLNKAKAAAKDFIGSLSTTMNAMDTARPAYNAEELNAFAILDEDKSKVGELYELFRDSIQSTIQGLKQNVTEGVARKGKEPLKTNPEDALKNMQEWVIACRILGRSCHIIEAINARMELQNKGTFNLKEQKEYNHELALQLQAELDSMLSTIKIPRHLNKKGIKEKVESKLSDVLQNVLKSPEQDLRTDPYWFQYFENVVCNRFMEFCLEPQLEAKWHKESVTDEQRKAEIERRSAHKQENVLYDRKTQEIHYNFHHKPAASIWQERGIFAMNVMWWMAAAAIGVMLFMVVVAFNPNLAESMDIGMESICEISKPVIDGIGSLVEKFCSTGVGVT